MVKNEYTGLKVSRGENRHLKLKNIKWQKFFNYEWSKKNIRELKEIRGYRTSRNKNMTLKNI